MEKGTRIAIIFFFQPAIKFQELIFMVGVRPEQCPDCYCLFKSRKCLYQHQQGGKCLKTVLFNRFKEKTAIIFDPKTESSKEKK